MSSYSQALQFLKGSKHTIVKSKIFQNLKENEIALRLEQPQKLRPSFYYKKIEGEFLEEKYLPFRDFAIYELILPHQSKWCKFFLVLQDWETNKLSLAQCSSYLKTHFLQFWAQHRLLKSFPLTTDQLLYVGSTFPEEQVYLHMVVNGYLFPSENLRWVMSQFRLFLSKWQPESEMETYFQQMIIQRPWEIIDERVYRKNGALRIPGSCVIVNGSVLNKYSLIQIYQDQPPVQSHKGKWTDYLVTATNQPGPKIPFCDVQSYQDEEEKSLAHDSQEVCHLLEKLLIPFQIKLGKNRSVWPIKQFVTRYDTIYATIQCRDCPFAQRTHRRSCLKLIVNPWATTLECWSSHCKEKRLWIHLKTADCITLFQATKMIQDDLDLQSFLAKNQPNWAITRYSAPIVQPYFMENYKWHLEQSAMCTQKTRQIFELLNRWKNRNFSYCFIGPRISFCQNVYQRLTQATDVPFYLYGSLSYQMEVLKSGQRSPKKNVVIQYESLWQVAHLYFDVIIIDEITTVLSCVTSSTNKTRLPQNAATFKDFLTHAKHVLMMDADLNAKTLSLVQDFSQVSDQCHLRINDFRNPELKKSIIFYMDRPKKFLDSQNLLQADHKQTLKKTASSWQPSGKDKFLASLKNRLLAKQRIVIISGSIKFFETEVEPWLTENKIGYKWYKQNSGHEEDLSDVNLFWSQESSVKIQSKKRHLLQEEEKGSSSPLQVVAFTNRITVGLSYEIQDFDSIFIYGSPGSVIPRLLMQMRGRIRLLKEPTIAMYIFKRSDFRVLTSWDAIWNHVAARKQILAQFRLEQERDQKGDWVQNWELWQKEYRWVAKQFVYHELESNLAKTNFLFETLKQLIHNQYTWIFQSCISTVSEETPVSSGTTTSSLVSHQDCYRVFAELSILPKEKIILQDWKTTHNRLQVSKSKIYHLFIGHPSIDLNEDQNAFLWTLYQIQQNRELWKLLLHNWFLERYPAPQDWAQKWNQGAIFQIGQEFCPKQPVRYHLLHEMVTLLGWKHIRDYDTIVSTRQSMGTAEARNRMWHLVKQYNLIWTSKEADHWKNLPGMIRKVSSLLQKFSGQSIRAFCTTCQGTFGPCEHIQDKKIHYSQYKTKDPQTQKNIKFYCFTYKMQPSSSDAIIQKIEPLFPSSSSVSD